MSTNLHPRWPHPRWVLRLRRCGLFAAWCGLLALGAAPAQAQKIVEAHVGMQSSLGVVEVHDVQPGASAQASYSYDDGGTRVLLQAQATRRALRVFTSGQDSRMDSRFSASAGARSHITLVDEAGRALDPAVDVALSLKAGASEVLLETVTLFNGEVTGIEVSFSALVDGANGRTGVVARWSRLVGPGGVSFSNCLGTPDLCVEGSWPQPTALDFTLEPTLVDQGFTLDLNAALSIHSGEDGPESGTEAYLRILSATATWGETTGRGLQTAAARMPERIGLRFDETGEILWANAAPVPEPGSWALLAAGLAGLAAWVRRRRAAVLVGALLAGPAAAWAQSIEAIATFNRSSPGQLIEEASRVREFRTDASITWPTTNGDLVSFTHRMAWMSGQRVRPPEPPAILNWLQAVDYSIGFQVEDPGLRGYTLSFDTLLRGALTSEWLGSSPDVGVALAQLGRLQAVLASDGHDLPLDTLDTPSQDTRVAHFAPFANERVDHAAHADVGSFTGSRYFTLSFTSPTFNQGNTLAAMFGGESVLRFGLDPLSPDFRNANYPGPDGELAAEHGHFVTVNVLFNAAPVPEPGSGALLLAGLLSVSVLAWRRGRVA